MNRILMRSGILIGLVVMATLMSFRHPMHVSVTEIKVDDVDNDLEVVIHIFMDDIEKAYRANRGDNELDITEKATKPDFKEFLGQYLAKNIQLSVNGKLEEGTFLGYEEEGDGIWCYIEVLKVKRVKTLTVKNTLLFDTYDDQTNLVHVEYHDDIQSAKLDGRKLESTFEIEK